MGQLNSFIFIENKNSEPTTTIKKKKKKKETTIEPTSTLLGRREYFYTISFILSIKEFDQINLKIIAQKTNIFRNIKCVRLLYILIYFLFLQFLQNGILINIVYNFVWKLQKLQRQHPLRLHLPLGLLPQRRNDRNAIDSIKFFIWRTKNMVTA